MNEVNFAYRRRVAMGLLIATVVGILAAAFGEVASSIGYGTPVDFWNWSLLFYLEIAAAPLVFLAFTGTPNRGLWFIGMLITGVFWSWFFYRLSNPDGIGVDFGLAFMMMAAPFGTTAALTVAAKLQDRRQPDLETRVDLGCAVFVWRGGASPVRNDCFPFLELDEAVTRPVPSFPLWKKTA